MLRSQFAKRKTNLAVRTAARYSKHFLLLIYIQSNSLITRSHEQLSRVQAGGMGYEKEFLVQNDDSVDSDLK